MRRLRSAGCGCTMRTLVKVFSTTHTAPLAREFERELAGAMEAFSHEYCVESGGVTVNRFSNENIEVQVENVRDHVVVVLHTQVPPVSDGLIELLGLLDAVNNAHPRRTFVA